MILEKLAVVRKIIESYYGKEKIRNIEYISSGRINDIFSVDLVGCDRDKVVVRVRNFNDSIFGQKFGAEKMVDEILKGSVNYPQIITCDSTKTIIPQEYTIMSFIEGRLFTTNDSASNYEELGRIAKKIHQAKVPEKYSREFMADIDGYYKKRFEGIIENSKKYDPKVYELIKDSMQYYYPGEYKKDDISLTHHDFHERNLIVNDDGINVLDWETARVEATEVEFIRAKYYLLNRTSKENFEAFIRGYGPFKFTDNFFMQEIMWLAKISNFERTFPPKKNEQNYWCSADFLNKRLSELMKKYRGKGTYTTFDEIIDVERDMQFRIEDNEVERQ